MTALLRFFVMFDMHSCLPAAERHQLGDALVPGIIFKYLSVEGGLASLRDMTIKFSRVGDFNDPFELKVGGIDEDDMMRIAEEAFVAYRDESSWRQFCERFPYLQLDDIRSEALALGFSPDFYHFFHVAFAKTRDMLIESLPKRANQDMGIACFSEVYNSILMWSHYAEFHKGIVIGYKIKLLPELTKVVYDRKRYVVPLYREKDPDWAKRLSATKFLDWSYEREWRCLVPTARLSISTKGNFHVLHHEPRTIDHIIMGINIDKTLRDDCEYFARFHPACKLYQARCHLTRYALQIDMVKV